MSETLKKRSEISDEFKWDIEAMFPDESEWDVTLNEAVELSGQFSQKFKGHLADSGETLLEAYKMRDELFIKLEDCLVYAHMKKDEDTTVSEYIGKNDKAYQAYAGIASGLSFMAPELMEADEDTIMGYIKNTPGLGVYEFAIKETFREKSHILSEKEENILAQLSEVTSAPDDIFSMLNNAEIKFGMIRDEEGNDVELTHGNFIKYMKSPVRSVRKDAYTHMYEAFKALNNTIATAYNYNVKNDVVHARIRNYTSSRAASLSGGNISEEVYDNLIMVVNEYLPVLHKYTNLRKRILGVDELKMYDVYVPLVNIPHREYPYEEGLRICKDALSILGKEYTDIFETGTQKERWVDVYENEGKRSGAYSFGCYNSKPYVLLNYSNTINDVFTIIHEMGHSINSYYTRRTQPYIYGDHHIFTAEVASTVNESLLMKYLIKNEKDPEIKKYLINHYIEEFRTTLFRQTMFAEFEKMTHEELEAGGVLTADLMNERYDELNKKYFGPDLSEDNYIKYEWSRIPHFYTAFYVYQYATGFSAATAISKRIMDEGRPAVDDYIRFLKQGTNDDPVNVLKIAGVDMSSPEPVREAMKTFKNLVEELESLL